MLFSFSPGWIRFLSTWRVAPSAIGLKCSHVNDKILRSLFISSRWPAYRGCSRSKPSHKMPWDNTVLIALGSLLQVSFLYTSHWWHVDWIRFSSIITEDSIFVNQNLFSKLAFFLQIKWFKTLKRKFGQFFKNSGTKNTDYNF